MSLTEDQLKQINCLRERAGMNAVTMAQAIILLERMGAEQLLAVSERIGGPALEFRKPSNCQCVPGEMVERCPVHVDGKAPEFEGREP